MTAELAQDGIHIVYYTYHDYVLYVILEAHLHFKCHAMPVLSNELLDLFISLETHLSVSDMLWRFKDDALQFMRILCTYYYFKSSADKFIPSV